MDCIAGIESSWNPNAESKTKTYKGLYSISAGTWKDSGTGYAYKTYINNITVSTSVAVAELYQKLKYEFGGGSQGIRAYYEQLQEGFTSAQVRTAIANFGEGNPLYAQDVMNCAGEMQAGNYKAAQGYIDDYHANRP